MLSSLEYQPLDLDKMVISLWAAGNGYVDKVPVEHVKTWEADLHAYMDATHPEIGQAILRTKDLPQETIDALRIALEDFNKSWRLAPA
ncbi:MAG: hypothetical protein R2838_19695 [Caldilineaceae bacterium]